MRKVALILIIIMSLLSFNDSFGQSFPSITNEGQHPLRHKADKIRVDASGFSGNLSGTDNNVQTAMETIDAMAGGGGAADCWEEVGGALTPALACVADALWELDGGGDLEPKV